MEGHAISGAYGHDVVCAALSVLGINTANAIEAFTDEDMSVELDEKKGLLSCQSDRAVSAEAELLIRAFELGVQGICDSYGEKFVKIKVREV